MKTRSGIKTQCVILLLMLIYAEQFLRNEIRGSSNATAEVATGQTESSAVAVAAGINVSVK